MKPNSAPENDEPLRRLLREWIVDTPLPPRFQEQVWRRIASVEAESAPRLGVRFRRWVELVLPRPKTALLYMALLLVLGIAAGSVTAEIRSNHLQATLSARYVRSLDPNQAMIEP